MRIIEDAALSAILRGEADNETFQIMLHALQERDNLELQNTRLKEAISPVLECHEEDKEFGLDNALFAVRKAKEIYKERGLK